MNPVFLLVSCLLAVSGVLGDVCYKDASLECGPASDTLKLANCNAIYGNYGHEGNVASEMHAYATLHIQRSYQYLLSSAYFNNYQTNRLGFSKLFRKLSDHAWEKSIELIKHVTKRGDIMDFSSHTTMTQPAAVKNVTVELSEIEALAQALDSQKQLAERAFYIHREATKNNHKTHDPEIAHYLEEEFVEDQAKVIRELAGHTSDLKDFVVSKDGQDLFLALYIFDQYLQKVV